MARGTNQKLKLYHLKDIMLSKTDDSHYLTMPQILAELEKRGVSAERKSIYTDLLDLEELGVEIGKEQIGKFTYYNVVGRDFELPELKLLVDSIQSSKFITAKKTNELIKKIEAFCSEHEARQLQRQVFVHNRIKTMNESIYYTVDAIHSAISDNKKIKFKYFKWNIKKEMELTHGGQFITVSPWGLSLEDENYYLIAYDGEAGKIKHYRVDKMLNISAIDEKRDGQDYFQRFDPADYSNKNFGMFGGEEKSITVELKNEMCGVFIDRFGKDITFVPKNDEYCTVRLKVALSLHFLGWIFALGPSVKIIGPEDILGWVKEELSRINAQYSE